MKVGLGREMVVVQGHRSNWLLGRILQDIPRLDFFVFKNTGHLIRHR